MPTLKYIRIRTDMRTARWIDRGGGRGKGRIDDSYSAIRWLVGLFYNEGVTTKRRSHLTQQKER